MEAPGLLGETAAGHLAAVPFPFVRRGASGLILRSPVRFCWQSAPTLKPICLMELLIVGEDRTSRRENTALGGPVGLYFVNARWP